MTDAPPPDVLVVGAGAVGLWVGGALAAGGLRVSVVVRGGLGANPAMVERRFPDGGGTLSYLMRVESPCEVVRPAVILIAVKSTSTAAVGADLAGCPWEPGHVVSLQNGVGNEAVLAAALPDWEVDAGALTTAVTRTAPWIVAGTARGGLGLATSSRTGDSAPGAMDRIAAAARTAGIDTRFYPDAAALKWSKLLLNLPAAAASGLLQWPPARVFGHLGLLALERGAWLEALAVMSALGLAAHALPGYPVDRMTAWLPRLPTGLLRRLAPLAMGRSRAGGLPGVARDLAAGRLVTEVAVLNGAVAQAGEATGVPTPVNSAYTHIYAEIAAGRIGPKAFADRPHDLIAAILPLLPSPHLPERHPAGPK